MSNLVNRPPTVGEMTGGLGLPTSCRIAPERETGRSATGVGERAQASSEAARAARRAVSAASRRQPNSDRGRSAPPRVPPRASHRARATGVDEPRSRAQCRANAAVEARTVRLHSRRLDAHRGDTRPASLAARRAPSRRRAPEPRRASKPPCRRRRCRASLHLLAESASRAPSRSRLARRRRGTAAASYSLARRANSSPRHRRRLRRRADVGRVRPEDDAADARREARPRRRLEPADEEAGDDDGVVEHR